MQNSLPLEEWPEHSLERGAQGLTGEQVFNKVTRHSEGKMKWSSTCLER